MTPFTDDDLAGLKAAFADDIAEGLTYANARDARLLEALVARLEAAEKIAELSVVDEHVDCDSKCGAKELIDAWRKAAGK